MIEEQSEVSAFDGFFHIRVREDNIWASPPSSSVTRFRLDFAAASITSCPTSVDPVKATLSTSM